MGALALAVAFKEKVLGQHGKTRPTILLASSWFCLLTTIGAAAWYQYVAVKLIAVNLQAVAERIEPWDVPLGFPLTHGWLWPGLAYGAMVISFFLGAVLFIVSSAHLMFARKAAPPVHPQP